MRGLTPGGTGGLCQKDDFISTCGCPKYEENTYVGEPSCYYSSQWDEFRKSNVLFSCALKKAWFYTSWLVEMSRLCGYDEVDGEEQNSALSSSVSNEERASKLEIKYWEIATKFNTEMNKNLLNVEYEEDTESINLDEENNDLFIQFLDNDDDEEENESSKNDNVNETV